MIRVTCRSAHDRGFSLAEVVVATALIGLGLVALLVASAAGTRTSDGCRKLTEAVFLAQEIREWTLKLPFSDPQTPGAEPGLDSGESLDSVDDLDDLMNVTCSPPRDGQGSPLADMVGWSETITLTWRDPADLQSPVAPGSSDIVYVQVDLSYQGRPELVTGWLVTRKNP